MTTIGQSLTEQDIDTLINTAIKLTEMTGKEFDECVEKAINIHLPQLPDSARAERLEIGRICSRTQLQYKITELAYDENKTELEIVNDFMADTMPEYRVERVTEALRGKSESSIIEEWLA